MCNEYYSVKIYVNLVWSPVA